MNLFIRLVLAITLSLALALEVSAQEKTSSVSTAVETVGVGEKAASAIAVTGSASSEQVRSWFQNLLKERPPELATVLATEPALLGNDAFLSTYPELARFVAEHPEVRSNPSFYLRGFKVPANNASMLDEIMEPLLIAAMFAFATLSFGWLVRTVIEQRRWNRLSRIQTEVHNKILDRFGTSQELLEYVRSPAGTRFLESAPIPLKAEQATQNAPVNRIIWSIQLGVVVAVGALGLLAASGLFDGETSKGLMAMGTIAFCVGAGFIASGAVSMFLSRRLGLWQTAPDAAEGLMEEVR
ncbi:MAG TPA: hypothetical protein VNM92_06335 [Thermoanaerobaculia bacterium]|nr:hypothetical protein [Thermoanaerobaculia bacterium]